MNTSLFQTDLFEPQIGFEQELPLQAKVRSMKSLPSWLGLQNTLMASLHKGKTPSHSARGVMFIVVGNGHGDTSSNPGRD